MLNLESVVQEFANVGLTIFCFVMIMFIVRWLDKNIFNKKRRNK